MDFAPKIKTHLEKIDSIIDEKLKSVDIDHFGTIRPFMEQRGKKIRPAICLLSAGICGGGYEKVIESAAIIEIIHNVTLIHDDIEDGSTFRRGKRTIHSVYGIPTAINSADALYSFAWEWMLGLPFSPKEIIELQKRYTGYIRKMISGQAKEIKWIREGDFDVSENQYIDMVSEKTASLMELSAETGAFLSRARADEIKSLKKFGHHLGIAFQITDDILNLKGNFKDYKKEIGGDIHEGKRTLILSHFMMGASDDKKKLIKDILSSKTDDGSRVSLAIELLDKSGSIDYAADVALKHSLLAKSAIFGLPESDDKESLFSLADISISRKS
jgi:geranylgeranyl pyrophosphate synthase